MAKSMRSKVKRQFRAKKRTEGVYAAAEAARLNRLHQKLKVLTTKDKNGDAEVPEKVVDSFSDEAAAQPDAMEIDTDSKRISTHGLRRSRREEWRTSKGMSARPQGGIAARHKSGRAHRRR
ncbi:uncharacterized protein LAESUDRAFT_733518 [Laetiporus sulphureus 93-53]|uniref:DUF2423 domain-containing protein n=1 Tax=Laetiporus sulphureus 93-53 TaxID=1314785 RepID=A0A165IEA1_9APHY|nr:uncharacterized protein LAESUDRAFT_733518 [Laetiporus sulphureus 93-53]KZT12959.1 hypothetical protein LAESUDRAFT_733518 [Laetiporus sulphureus 93-53]